MLPEPPISRTVREAARFYAGGSKAYAEGNAAFTMRDEFTKIRKLYGNMNHLQTLGKDAHQAYVMFP